MAVVLYDEERTGFTPGGNPLVLHGWIDSHMLDRALLEALSPAVGVNFAIAPPTIPSHQFNQLLSKLRGEHDPRCPCRSDSIAEKILVFPLLQWT